MVRLSPYPRNQMVQEMKPIFQKLITESTEDFAFKDYRAFGYHCPWHAHSEYELILVLQGDGYRVVGDNLAALAPGDLVFLGSRLPHIWQADSRNGRESSVHQLLIQFEKEMFGDLLLKLSAMEHVRSLLKRAGRGLHVGLPTRAIVADLMSEMVHLPELQRLIQLLKILSVIAVSNDCRPLASLEFVAQSSFYDEDRINRVLQFLNEHHSDQGIRLRDAARVAGMSEGAFSRFFRLHTGKTFPQFHNELRVGRACRLLSRNEKTITEIAYECGFANISNFNRQFLRLKSVSPKEFRKKVQRREVGSENWTAEIVKSKPENSSTHVHRNGRKFSPEFKPQVGLGGV